MEKPAILGTTLYALHSLSQQGIVNAEPCADCSIIDVFAASITYLQHGRDDIAVMLQSKVETLCAADSDSKKRGRSDMDVEPTRPHSRDRISSSVQSQNRQRI